MDFIQIKENENSLSISLRKTIYSFLKNNLQKEIYSFNNFKKLTENYKIEAKKIEKVTYLLNYLGTFYSFLWSM